MTEVSAARRRRSDGEQTRQRVLDAAVATILEKGYYQASSNEIARRAGVTWGAIQHQFGTREALLLEVLDRRWRRQLEAVATATVVGVTLEERLHCVLDVLASHYAQPDHLVAILIVLDLSHNPATSAETRREMTRHGAELEQAWQPLFAQALGSAASERDLVVYAFSALRGYLTGWLVSTSTGPRSDDTFARDLLVRGVASTIREEAAARGLAVG
ncbi:MAG TPA: TetR/AcrR family transcriptional regulator [Acidimicrobiia bacterium]|nr:TetR/AcrR family transcriptional regulator [Acidimicrobiia bacterium]